MTLRKKLNFWPGKRVLSLGLAIIALTISGAPVAAGFNRFPSITVTPTPAPEVAPAPVVVPLPRIEASIDRITGITRLAQVHTERPERPRFKVFKYTVQKGDTPWSISQKFDLSIESILWGNEGLSADAGDLQIDRGINILPTDGVLHTVSDIDTLDRLQLLHGVPYETIQNYPGNDLAGLAHAEKLPVGAKIIVPGGINPVVWREPGPAVVPGKGRKSPGFYSGNLIYTGSGYFTWPVSPIIITQPYWSGHPAIDIDTYYRQPIFASDNGTVIFSGWDTTGYGNLIIIDHGNGYWTYYAHNSFNLVSAGQGVLQGEQIAESGSTGNSTGDHIDFRIRVDGGSFLNPANFLP
jgi:murein DD-endopeptidase MepM/ murein hydrolase activator NlpD